MEYSPSYRSLLLIKKATALDEVTNNYERKKRNVKQQKFLNMHIEDVEIDLQIEELRIKVEEAKKDILEYIAEKYLNKV